MLETGAVLPERAFRITRADLVRYAGASGDFNPIHWSDRVAAEAGLPGVIGHGMLTMALAARAVTEWTGDPGALVAYTVKFTKPVEVPDDEQGAELAVSGVVKKVEGGVAQVDLTVSAAGERVLTAARAQVRAG
ncbi:MaoC/PaaZ C-terminal domain-containing protein [Longispora albida]|uniref:MaoC/PaaZ C-terminal domain-containing protein n=1 Tax=Longispora albida TaxID=203523 RepID=UPI00036EC238|nr:MaoC/PaaZ C-terminal domain-containing protein [Longispora albida]